MNKITAKLRRLEGAITERFDPWTTDNLLRSPSPGVNWLFGKNHGMPFGYSMLLWGPPKAGKTLLSNAYIGQMHRDYPDAIAVKFDTEFREEGQMSAETAAAFGIDLDRYVVFQVNRPGQVFDTFVDKIGALAEENPGTKFLTIIDSITGVQGRREAESDTVEQHQIGDHAMTVQVGLKRILEVQKRHRIGLILTAHARAELDMWKAKRSKTKPAAAFGALHHCEFFVNVERNETASGTKDALENKMEDTRHKGMDDGAEMTGHKIRVWMQDNSMGPKNRVAEFTINYQKGIVNQHEEVFSLGVKWEVIKKINAMTYGIGEHRFTGKPACLAALAASPALQQTVIAGLMAAEKTIGTTEIPDTAAEAEAFETSQP